MKILRMMIIGMLISLSASYGTIALFNTDVVFTGDELLKQFTIAIILGPVIGIGSLLFQLEKISFWLQLIIHYLYVTACVLTAGWFGGWYTEQSFVSLGKVLLIQLVVYILVWLILHVIAQRDIEKINESLQKKRRDRV